MVKVCIMFDVDYEANLYTLDNNYCFNTARWKTKPVMRQLLRVSSYDFIRTCVNAVMTLISFITIPDCECV